MGSQKNLSPAVPPQIVVHSLDDAIAALRAAKACNTAILLASAPAAAGFAGPAWFHELAQQAAAAVPGAEFIAVLDCADAPGHALAAIRTGVAAIAIDLADTRRAPLPDIAAQAGVAIIAIDYANAFDMQNTASRDEDRESACRTWLKTAMAVDTARR